MKETQSFNNGCKNKTELEEMIKGHDEDWVQRGKEV